MNAHAELRMDAPTFLAWIDGREERYELARGRVEKMVRVSRDHSRIVTRVMLALGAQLSRDDYDIAAGEFAVSVGRSVRFPDVLVEPAGRPGKGYVTSEPLLLIEVLSPSTSYVDLNDKPAEYLALASLRTYLVLSQDEPCAHVWERGADGAWPPSPALVNDPAAVIALPALGASLALADLYAGIGG